MHSSSASKKSTPRDIPPLSTVRLFNYDGYSKTKSPYPRGRIRPNHYRLQKWIAQRVSAKPDSNDSDHDAEGDDEEPETKRGAQDLYTPSRVGPRAMADFFEKYRNLNKSNSPSRCKRPSAACRYLRRIDQLHEVPHPMGIVKWRGAPNELNLQFSDLAIRLWIDRTKWATRMQMLWGRD